MNINSEVKKRIQHKDANHKARRILSFLGAALLGAGVACAISVPLMLTQCSDQHIFGNVTSNNMKNLREAGDEIKFNISLTKKVQAIYLTMDSGDFLDYDNQIEINGVSVDNTNDPWFSLYNSQDKKISNFDFSVKLMKDSY
jgi:formylmethanofuran dehydrogenase subunit E-like metal-binding protein